MKDKMNLSRGRDRDRTARQVSNLNYLHKYKLLLVLIDVGKWNNCCTER